MIPPTRALSIRNPWATLIMGGYKLVENRTWDTRWRGKMLVHAGKTVERGALSAAAEFGITPDDLRYGYLGTVELTGTHWGGDAGCCGPWAEDNAYHWVLADPEPLPLPIIGPGRLGLYAVPLAIQDALGEAA